MGKLSLRRVLRRCGLNVAFRDVICPEEIKTIWVEPNLGAKVTVRRTFVFLDVPEPGDLYDSIAEVGTNPEGAVYESPDGLEIARVRGRGTMLVGWRPRGPVIPYGIYTHEYSWRPLGSYGEPALHTEVGCDMRTGVQVLEMLTPATFEAAVAFKRPWWPRLTSERSLMQYALRQLQAGGERPTLMDYGRRLEWRLIAPSVGDRYICVVFHAHGVAQWQDRLKATSMLGRLRQMVRPLLPA
jgi:hypothetical protein